MDRIIISGITSLILSILIEVYIVKNGVCKKEKDIKDFLKSKKFVFRVVIVTSINMFFAYSFTEVSSLIICNATILILFYIAFIDFKTKYIDNKLFFLFGFVGIISCAINKNVVLADSLITGAITFIFLFIISKITKGAVGMGDAMVLAVLGTIYGYKGLMLILLVSSILVSVAAAILLVKNFTKNRRKEIAFTPYIFLAVLILTTVSNI